MTYAFTRESEVRAAFWQGWRGCPRPKKVAGDVTPNFYPALSSLRGLDLPGWAG